MLYLNLIYKIMCDLDRGQVWLRKVSVICQACR